MQDEIEEVQEKLEEVAEKIDEVMDENDDLDEELEEVDNPRQKAAKEKITEQAAAKEEELLKHEDALYDGKIKCDRFIDVLPPYRVPSGFLA